MIFIAINFFVIFLMFLSKSKGYLDSMMKSLLVIGGLIVLYTEVSSLFMLLNSKSCNIFWAMTLLVSGILIWRLKLDLRVRKIDIEEFKKTPIFIAIAIFAFTIFAVTFFASMYYPPNTSDSMVYHMPRVMHWIQNQSVMHYPTNSIRQIYMGPFAEFVILNFQLMTKSDTFANLVQWFSFVGGCFGVFGVAKLLGLGTRAQFFSFLIAATVPMAILQATGTQTDLVASFLLVTLVYFILNYKTEKTLTNAAFIAISLGLAILTKGTSYIFAFPFMLWWLIDLLKTKDKGLIVKSGSIVLGLVLLINLGHWTRNFTLFGSILVPKSHAMHYKNDTIKPNYLLSNSLKNITLELGINNGMILSGLNSLVTNTDKFLGVEENSPLITFPNQSFLIPTNSSNELDTGSKLHFILFGVLFLLMPLIPVVKKNRGILIYAICCAGGFFLFGLLLKWQPWGARLHLPFFMLSSVFLAAILSDEKLRFVFNPMIFLFFIMSLKPLFFNQIRPLLIPQAYSFSRTEQLFNNRWNIAEPYLNGLNIIKNTDCRSIQLTTGDDTYEYPIFAAFNGKIKVQHTNITNETKVLEHKKPFSDFKACQSINLKQIQIKL